jgi:hypothetical protein
MTDMKSDALPEGPEKQMQENMQAVIGVIEDSKNTLCAFDHNSTCNCDRCATRDLLDEAIVLLRNVIPAAPSPLPVATRDKSEGVRLGAIPPPPDPPPLPVDEKFTLWLDDEGDYMIQSQVRSGLLAHGSTPEDAVWCMRQVLELAASLVANPVAEMTDEEAVRAVYPGAFPRSEATSEGAGAVIVQYYTASCGYEHLENLSSHIHYDCSKSDDPDDPAEDEAYLLAWSDARSKLQPVPPNHL